MKKDELWERNTQCVKNYKEFPRYMYKCQRKGISRSVGWMHDRHHEFYQNHPPDMTKMGEDF